jgi:hypothetical protein
MQIGPRLMAGVRFRGFLFFAKMWMLPNWIREKGNSLSSLRSFLKELSRFDRRLPRAAFMDPNTMIQFLFYGTPAYSFLKEMYLHYRAFRSGHGGRS